MMKEMDSLYFNHEIACQPCFLYHVCIFPVPTHLVGDCFELLVSSCAVGVDFLFRAIDILCDKIIHLCRMTLRLDFGLFYRLASFRCSQGFLTSLGGASLLMGSFYGFASAMPGRAAFSTRRHCAVSCPFGVLTVSKDLAVMVVRGGLRGRYRAVTVVAFRITE